MDYDKFQVTSDDRARIPHTLIDTADVTSNEQSAHTFASQAVAAIQANFLSLRLSMVKLLFRFLFSAGHCESRPRTCDHRRLGLFSASPSLLTSLLLCRFDSTL